MLMGANSDVSTSTIDPVALDAMVEPDPVRGRSRARLIESGVPVWALISRMGEPTADNIARVAAEYAIPEIAVLAALRYYERNKPYIDAFILLNNEPFGLTE
jgi:hypothetical protein